MPKSARRKRLTGKSLSSTSSREDDSSLHGYGQQILGDIAQIYSGRFEKSEKNGEYTCTLVMQMKERQTEDFA